MNLTKLNEIVISFITDRFSITIRYEDGTQYIQKSQLYFFINTYVITLLKVVKIFIHT